MSAFILVLASTLGVAGSAVAQAPATPEPARPAGWQAATHGDSAPPDYARLFGMDRVHELRIVIAPDRFRAMQDDLQSLAPSIGAGIGLALGAGAAGRAGGAGGLPGPSELKEIAAFAEGIAAACTEKAADASCSVNGINGRCTELGAGPRLCLPEAVGKLIAGMPPRGAGPGPDVGLGFGLPQVIQVLPVCPGEIALIRQEYFDHDHPYRPGCDEFTQSVPYPSHYGFNDWNSGTHNWAILRNYMVGSIYCISTNYGEARPLTSGYRNPVRNSQVSTSGSFTGPHTYGWAADLDTPNAPDNTMYFALRDLAKGIVGSCGYACVEPRIESPNHIHIDYRSWPCGPGW